MRLVSCADLTYAEPAITPGALLHFRLYLLSRGNTLPRTSSGDARTATPKRDAASTAGKASLQNMIATVVESQQRTDDSFDPKLGAKMNESTPQSA